MKKTLFKIIPAFIVLWIFLSVSSGVAAGAGADSNKTAAGKNESAAVGYLENVLFEKLAGRERVSLVVSRQPALSPPSLQPDNSLLVRLENLFVPDGMREPLGAGRLLNVTAVQAQPQTTAGRSWVNLKIILKESVPYSIRQEGKLVIIDFNISGIEAKLSAVREKQAAVSGQGADEDQEIKRPARRDFTKRQADRIISLDFQEADIKSVLRLMAEYGNVSIISGDDVKGNVTLSMKSVPWDQALEAILRVHGLTKQETGDVITVMTLERQRKDIQVKKAAEEEIRKAEEDRKAKEIQELAEKGKLRQILIEAKIVEASEDFVRNLGIQWGFGNHSSIGSYGLGMAFGTNPLTQTNAQKLTYPSEIPFLKAGTVDPLTMAVKPHR